MHRYAHVDSMRALAAVLVVITHASEYGHFAIPGARASGDWLFSLAYGVDFGRIGVVLFFAISGFVIPSSLRAGQHPGAFWVRRFFRLYPLFWFSIPLALVTHWWLMGINISLFDIAANLTMFPEAFGAQYIQGVYWTLTVELIFYVLCYCLFLLRANENPLVLALAALITVVLYYLYQNAHVGPFLAVRAFFPRLDGDFLGPTFGHLSIMFWGALCRLEYERHSRFLLSAIVALATFWLVIYPVSGWLVLQTAKNGAETLRLFAPYPIAIALFLILLFRVKLQFRLLVWIGQISYSLYLLHDVVVYAIGQMRKTFVPDIVPDVVTYVVLCLIVAIVVSALTYRYIENPMQELGGRLSAHLRKREPAG